MNKLLKGTRDGQNIDDRQGAENTEVWSSTGESLQPLRAAQSLYEKICTLPHLLP
jgi:hypothetical protein